MIDPVTITKKFCFVTYRKTRFIQHDKPVWLHCFSLNFCCFWFFTKRKDNNDI